MNPTQPVEDFRFQHADGREVHLSDFAGKPLVLIFLRHLA
jgi:peroxiredoxin